MEDQLGSPPLTRGIPNQAQKSYVGSRITPAYAGNTPDEHVEGMATEDHPRLRGEYLKIAITQLTDKGSPPLTRGILACGMITAGVVRITPAYAGNTFLRLIRGAPIQDHPRLRGEYVMGAFRRGKLSGITPAYAGNTLKESLIYSIFPLSATKFHLVSHTLEMS